MTARVERYNTTDDFSTFFSVLSPDKSEFNAKGIEIENGLFKADIEIKNPNFGGQEICRISPNNLCTKSW